MLKYYDEFIKDFQFSQMKQIMTRISLGVCNCIWAVTCDFQQCGILTSVDSDEPVQPPF